MYFKQMDFFSDFSPTWKFPFGAIVEETENKIIVSLGELTKGMKSVIWTSGEYLSVVVFEKEKDKEILSKLERKDPINEKVAPCGLFKGLEKIVNK